MIPDRLSKSASRVLGAFTIAVTLVQVADLAVWARVAVGMITLASAVFAAVLHFQAKQYDNALRWAAARAQDRDAPLSTDYVFRFAITEAAFTEVCRTSDTIYERSNVPLERTLKWWRQFPEGVFAAYHEPRNGVPELAAYLSIWPIKPSTYAKLRAGKLRERELSHQSIEGIASSRPRRYWYVANIVVGKRHRRRPVLRLLIQYAARQWLRRGQLGPTVSVVALAFSPEGGALLRRFGFLMLSETSADGWPIYELEVQQAQLEERVANAI